MEFEIQLRSVHDVQVFVDIATSRPFPVLVGNQRHRVNGKSFMEIFSLDVSRPLLVMADCSREEAAQFLRDAEALLNK